ncbi:transposase domain-containing protein [Paraburkholderia humisilvae]|uniref:transposase domain-containing protein n=1 Tax=Paraburkholderia humisilvae TaxID=627669 RepID=UPI0035EBFC1B
MRDYSDLLARRHATQGTRARARHGERRRANTLQTSRSAARVPGVSLIMPAIRATGNRDPPNRCVRGFMTRHNRVRHNAIERDIRPFCTGRSSWLFSNSVAGAKASAMVYSLMLTCRACNVEPHAYLLHVLTELPQRAPDADVTDLLPFNFAKQKSKAMQP